MKNSDFSVENNIVPYFIPLEQDDYDFMFLCEAPGKTESEKGEPLVGDAGSNFNKWLSTIKVNRKTCIIGNVFRYRPEKNNINHFFCSASIALQQDIELNEDMPKFNSKRLIKHFDKELRHLRRVVVAYKPKIIVAMGNVACWALLGEAKITQIQGKMFKKTIKWGEQSYKATILACYHPASTLYDPDKEKAIIEVFKQAKKYVKSKDK